MNCRQQEKESIRHVGREQQTSGTSRERLIHTKHKDYGSEILKPQEKHGYEAVTTIASAPGLIKGMFHPRSIIDPVVDIRAKRRLGKYSQDKTTVVIILNAAKRVSA